MPKLIGTESQFSPVQSRLRDQMLTIFRDSRQLKEGSAQLRQRLVSQIFGTIQGQIDQRRSERFSESEASKARKGALIQTGVKAAIPVVGGAVTGGIAGGLSGVEGGAGLGALAGASAGFGLPTGRAGAPASILAENLFGQASLKQPGGGVVQKGITPPSISAPSAGTQLVTPTFPEDFVPAAGKAITPSDGVQKATENLAAIAGLSNDELRFAGDRAVEAGDDEAVIALAREVLRRGLAE